VTEMSESETESAAEPTLVHDASEDAPKAERPEGAPEPSPPKAGGSGTLIGIVGFLLALSAGFFIGQFFKSGDAGVELEEGTRYKVLLRGDEPMQGSDDALVTIIEFADYQCPYCAKAKEPLEKAMEEFGDDVRLVYKHFPLPGHPAATPAAKAAWAAHQQGKFWEMHALLFDSNANVNKASAEASSMGLDAARFEADMASEQAAKAVDDDLFAGAKLGLTGTPAFFVNGHKYVGLKSAAQWEEIISAELGDAKALVDDGVARADVYAKLMEGAVDQRRERPEKAAPGELDPEQTYRVTVDDRPALGPADALVTVIVFSDFQCPYCSQLAPVVHELVEGNPDVRVVFRNLPLPNHPRARDAAKAALAAHRQGKFWEMHDRLFADQARLREVEWAELATEIGLDVDRFAADFADPALDTMIEEDERLARHFQLSATPSVFVNGRYLRGAQTVSAYQLLVDEERKKAQALGVPAEQVYDAILRDALKGPQ
jgi:protein-disulfide isomerase